VPVERYPKPFALSCADKIKTNRKQSLDGVEKSLNINIIGYILIFR
jgi:hypothetical protein